MTTDRTTRLLTSLQRSGSTSRVLNLLTVEQAHGHEAEHRSAPLFRDPVLNSCVIVKHRLRLDELYMFDTGKTTVTKVILPFDKADLKLGGRAIMVGQRGWTQALRAECREGERVETDIEILQLIDKLPALDPFLLREQLRRHGREVARCYFALSPGDVAKMRSHAAVQIERLIARAFAEHGGDRSVGTARMVEALLSSEADDRLAPLRATLRLEGEAFSEGVFSWRGFLYYKWALSQLWPQLTEAAQGMERLVVAGTIDPAGTQYMEAARVRLRRAIHEHRIAVSRTLGVYDHAFNELTRNAEPDAFVDFLRRAPGMFVDLGEKVGAIAHIASYWGYRFPKGRPMRAQTEEAIAIFQDFESGLGVTALAA
jgi:hypothetical protein